MRNARAKLLSVVLAVMVALTFAMPAFADDAPEAEKPSVQAEKENEPKPEKEPTQKPTEAVQSEQTGQPEENAKAGESSSDREAEDQSKDTPDDSSAENNAAKKKSTDKGLKDGTYLPDSFSFGGGTGKAGAECEKVIIRKGKNYAVLKVSSAKMTHIFMGKASSNEETPSLYDPQTNALGKDVYPIGEQKVTVPVKVNEKNDCALRTTAMSEPHWVNYTYKIKLTKNAVKISNSTDLPENLITDEAASPNPSEGETADPGDGTESEDSTESTEPENPEEPETEEPGQQDPENPSDRQELTAGTWKVKATTDRKMFYIYPKDTDPAWTILKINKDKSMTATITLSGQGYDYVYMGTPSEAKKAGKKNWSKAKIVKGYYTFTVPVSALDKKLDITPHSKKYEADGNVNTDPWRPNKWIIFYSSGAEKTSDDAAIETDGKPDQGGNNGGTQTKFPNNKKPDKVSKWKDDSGKSTSAVNNSTSLKDGVYKPDRFSWSGGSGRLAYIRCNKITVRGGKAFATIEFSSTHYDHLKANGRIYSKQGGGNSKFVIPVKLNANNTIIGRTTAMSQPHWIKYTIFIYKAGATAGSKGAAAGTDGHATNTKELTDKAPDLLGLKSEGTVKIEYAKYFRIFKYEQGVTLICIDQSTGTALENTEDTKKETAGDDAGTDSASSGASSGSASATKPTAIADRALKASEPTLEEEADAAGATSSELAEAAEADAKNAANDDQGKVEYDEEGKPIAKTDSERTNDLYLNNVVNYLVVPKDAELPAGLEKDCIIIQKPVEDAYIASPKALTAVAGISQTEAVGSIGMDAEDVQSKAVAKAVQKGEIKTDEDYEKPDFRMIVEQQTDLAVLPAEVLPEKITKMSSEEDEDFAKQKTEILRRLQMRYSALSVPMIVDRSSQEESSYGKAEWYQVYGAIFGEEKTADSLVKKYEKEHRNEKISDK